VRGDFGAVGLASSLFRASHVDVLFGLQPLKRCDRQISFRCDCARGLWSRWTCEQFVSCGECIMSASLSSQFPERQLESKQSCTSPRRIEEKLEQNHHQHIMFPEPEEPGADITFHEARARIPGNNKLLAEGLRLRSVTNFPHTRNLNLTIEHDEFRSIE
jgi:hypothetical protein